MSKVSCPYCGSIQVKAMSNQPKKYPRPSDPDALANWQKGYDCKKCGNDFVVTPPKPTSILVKLLGWALLGVIGFFIYMAVTSPAKDAASTKNQEATQITENAPQEEDPLKQEFSKEAEEAAHAYIPPTTEPEQKSIADSQDQNDTLSIKTTVRAKDE